MRLPGELQVFGFEKHLLGGRGRRAFSRDMDGILLEKNLEKIPPPLKPQMLLHNSLNGAGSPS